MSLELIGVSHGYGSGAPQVLADISFEAGADDTVAILGPSGSGKTTLLSIMGGLLRPNSGLVTLDGWHLDGRPPPAGGLSWVFQTINLFGRRTVLDNVAIGALAVGSTVTEARARGARMVEAVGLGGMEQRLAMRLSGGEAQRVGIARALVGSPRYVLADEPTGQLDRSTSELVADVLFSARPPGTTLVTATHDLRVAERCRRRYTLIDGRLTPRQ